MAIGDEVYEIEEKKDFIKKQHRSVLEEFVSILGTKEEWDTNKLKSILLELMLKYK